MTQLNEDTPESWRTINGKIVDENKALQERVQYLETQLQYQIRKGKKCQCLKSS